MRNYIAFAYNPENDDLLAVIFSGGDEILCYSHTGQHSTMSRGYLEECEGAAIDRDSLDLAKEVLNLYNSPEDVAIPLSYMLELTENLNN